MSVAQCHPSPVLSTSAKRSTERELVIRPEVTFESVIEKMTKQSQEVEGGSSAYQAGGDITVNHGLTYQEARSLALDVFNANFYKLADEARTVAESRAREITDAALQKLAEKHPEGLESARDPGFQHSLFSVQRDYACTGDGELGGLLVDLLVERSQYDQRSFIQIVLDESIKTAPKLTNEQLATLATVFLLRYVKNHGLVSLAALAQYLDTVIKPFAGKWASSFPSFQHLQFAGCGAIDVMSTSLAAVMKSTYGGIFVKGFTAEELAGRGINLPVNHPIYVACDHVPGRGRIKVLNESQLNELFEENAITDADRGVLRQVYADYQMSEIEIRTAVVERCPYMEELFDLWSPDPMGRFSLTSVGMAIGHANVQRVHGSFADLSIWIH